jgi:hypothetical protein
VLDLPRIVDADYDRYRANPLYRRIYTVLRGATYPWQRDMGLGSHKGVDIASIPETPVYAIQEGKVIESWWRGNWWNVVVIEHDYQDKKIYSSYAHLWDIFVREGESVTKWQFIGEVADTGNASGPHLHRQIDTNQNGVYPFHFYNCPGELSQIVNNGLCRNQLLTNTLDPIAFIEAQLANPTANTDWFFFGWFVGGYAQQGKLQLLHMRQDDPNTRLTQPIEIIFDTEKVSIFPQKMTFVGSQRTIYIRGLQAGLTTVSLVQGGKTIHKLPLLIGEDNTFHVDNEKIVSLFAQIP